MYASQQKQIPLLSSVSLLCVTLTKNKGLFKWELDVERKKKKKEYKERKGGNTWTFI